MFNWRQSGAHSDKGTMRQHAEADWAWELLTLKFGSELCSARCPMYSKLMLIQIAYKANAQSVLQNKPPVSSTSDPAI